MNDEQRSRLAAIAREWAMMCQYPTVERDDAHWLLALVRELDEENARLGQPRATLYSESDAAQELKRAEQQLATVTAERDELKRGPWVAECLKLRLEKENLQQAALRATAMTAERAETAEKRVAELQALVDAARVGLTDITGAAERMLRIVDSYTFRTAEEAAIGTPARLLVDLLPEMRRLARELATKEPR